MSDKFRFEVHVTGEGVSPENVQVRAIAGFLVAVEEIVLAIAKQDHPDLDLGKQGALKFESLKKGSLDIAYMENHSLASPSLGRFVDVVNSGDGSSLSARALKRVKEFVDLNRTNKTTTEISENSNGRKVLATITPDTTIAGPALISGVTTLYGELLRIGGASGPRALMRFSNSPPLSCKVKSTELASEMGERLYETIGVRGKGEWKVGSMEIHEFRIEELTKYRQTTLTKAFESLREVAGKYYDEIEDIDAFVADLRGREPEDE